MESEVAGRNIIKKIVEGCDDRGFDNRSKQVVFGAIIRCVQQYGAARCEEAEEDDGD